MKNYDTAAAVACLGGVFLDILKGGDIGLSGFEREAVLVGHMTIAAAAALALESYDDELCASLPAGSRIHERRPRTLATTFGDLTFARRVCVDRYGNTFAPLDDAIDLARNARVSPHAQEFLVDAASEGSYAKAAHFMEAAGGSSVSARTVMNVMRLAGEACEEADVALAHDLYANGVLPEADADDEEICMEADGCWIPLQDGGNVEVKAMVAYAGKAGPGRVERVRPVRFGCVSGPRAFWAQGMAATATRFDMSKVRVCHAGFDGEAWCKQAADYLPAAASVDGNLDPFHVNRAIGSCFAEPGADAERQVMQCIWFGRAGDAADLLEALADDGLARPKNAAQVAAYLRNNAEFIRSCPAQQRRVHKVVPTFPGHDGGRERAPLRIADEVGAVRMVQARGLRHGPHPLPQVLGARGPDADPRFADIADAAPRPPEESGRLSHAGRGSSCRMRW